MLRQVEAQDSSQQVGRKFEPARGRCLLWRSRGISPRRTGRDAGADIDGVSEREEAWTGLRTYLIRPGGEVNISKQQRDILALGHCTRYR